MDKIKSVMIGHAIGDALGVPVEFCDREDLEKNPIIDMIGYGTYKIPAGCWSDDTSMSLCALESLAKGNVDYDEIMSNFCKWYYDADFTATDEVFDIGNTCYDAIYNYSVLKYSIQNCGCYAEYSNGNGSLMRIHPFVLYLHYNNICNEDAFINIIAKASSLTHGHQCSVDGCVIYAYILKEILINPCKKSIYIGLQKAKEQISTEYYERFFTKDIQMLNKANVKSGGYIVDTLEAALWCVLTTDNYRDCVLKAVNLGNDTDTVAAVAGGLAGALYGINSIPDKWLKTLKCKNEIEMMCENAYHTWRSNNA